MPSPLRGKLKTAFNNETGEEAMGRQGFTLVELLVVLAVGSSLFAISVPGNGFFLGDSRLASVTNDMVASLHLARSEAIKRNARVTVCKTGHPDAATPNCEPGARWEQGWLVFVDGGARGTIDAGDTVLWIQDQPAYQASITPSNYSSYVSYLPTGASQGPNHFANGALSICVAGRQRDIIINSAGRPRIEAGSC